MKCSWPYCNNELRGRQTRYCGSKCKNKGAVDTRRRKVKSILVAEHGGKCIRCGYKKYEGALQFHHRDSDKKEFQIGSGSTIALTRQRKEAKKCDLLCANCHAEVEHESNELRKADQSNWC